MNVEDAKSLFGIESEVLPSAFFAAVPRCVILDKSLPKALFRLYCYMIARCNHDAPVTWVSQQTIADDLGLQRKNINRDIKALEARGLIAIGKTLEGSNVYRINDVTRVYGEAVSRMSWSKRQKQAPTPRALGQGQVPPPSQGEDYPRLRARTTPVSGRGQDPVSGQGHKESEAHESESRCRRELDTPGRPGAARSPSELDLGKRWLEYAKSVMPWQNGKKWTPEGFAGELAKLKASTDLNDQGLEGVLVFVQGDEFWRKNAISPSSLLGKSKNGNRKIDNLLLSMQSSKSVKESQKKANIQANIDRIVAEMEAKA